MPIPVKCSCGKAVNVRDELAGKAIKCPGCGNPVKVGSTVAVANASAGKPAAAGRTAQQAAPAAAAKSAGLDDLFTEEGFDRHVAQVCPACRKEMKAGAILCTNCGYNKQTGERFEAHKTAGVDISHGEVALQKAGKDIDYEKAMQDKLLAAGMPPWVMALVLFFIVSAVTIAVIAINNARRLDGAGGFNPMATFLILGFGAVLTVSLGAYFSIVARAFKTEMKQGLLAMFIPPYWLYFVYMNFRTTWKSFATFVVLLGFAIGLYVAALRAGL